MPIKPADLEAALLRKGFRVKLGRHRRYWLYRGETQTGISVMVSHSRRDYGDTLVGLVARQMWLTRKQLADFIDCKLTQEGYIAHLRSRNVLRDPAQS